MTDADRRTVQNGNGTLHSCLSILEACRAMNIPAALGNPASSLMWHAPELQMQGAGALALAEWRVDFCQCGTSWMKPTRFWMLQCVEDERDPLDRAPRLPPLFSNPEIPLQHSKSEPTLQLTGVVAGSEANPVLQDEEQEEEKEGTATDIEPPTATALEIIQAAEPEKEVLELGQALSALDTYVKGRNSENRAGKKLQGDAEAAFRVGWWTVFLSLPINIWPIALKLQEVGSLQRVFLDFWGSMLLQFLFCVGSTLGVSVRYTLEGWLGTALATLNMLLLNNVGNWMAGGSYASRLEFNSTATNDTVVTSRWLPLCNTNADLSYHGCVLNLNAGLMEEAEYGKAAVVLLDTILFMAMMLFFGFNTNVRLFSISTHIYLAMSFLDPSTGAFDIQPSLATNYFIIVSISSLAVILCFLLPRPLTSTAQARSILQETGAAVAMILESLPLTSSELCRSKAQAAMGEMSLLIKDLDFHLGHMWFEDFSILRKRALPALAASLLRDLEDQHAELRCSLLRSCGRTNAGGRADADPAPIAPPPVLPCLQHSDCPVGSEDPGRGETCSRCSTGEARGG
eukprot:s6254_g2.t2